VPVADSPHLESRCNAMTARESIGRSTAAIAYLIAITGLGVLTLKLSSLLATQAIVLAQPYLLDDSPCMHSLIEQRRMAAQVAPAAAERIEIG
jgi:hypothetical protein